MIDKIKIAVVTDNHPVDMIAFTRMFNSFEGVESYVQSLEMLAKDEANWNAYDVVVYYNLSFDLDDYKGSVRKYYEKHLGKTKQGILLLHHGVLSYRDPIWDGPSGVKNREFKYHWNQTMRYDILIEDHPIVQGLSSFTMVDESYEMEEPLLYGSKALITVDHPLSMKTIAWTREYGQSRVFCYTSGHDISAYGDMNFLKILYRGILWCAWQI
jgi:hypothetical protein